MDLEHEFVSLRPLLLRIAYHVVGTVADAEDVVQEAWVRWAKQDPTGVREPRALLTTIVSRLALNAARDRERRREVYPGPWLPEPVADDRPEWELLQRDGLGHALDVVLSSVSPEQATAFVLREVLDLDYVDIAEIVGCTYDVARQHVSRARRRVRDAFPTPREELSAVGRAALSRLVEAVIGGDVAAVAALLAPESVLYADGGGRVSSARRPVFGSDAIARFLLGIATRADTTMEATIAIVNGGPALLIAERGVVTLMVSVRVTDAGSPTSTSSEIRRSSPTSWSRTRGGPIPRTAPRTRDAGTRSTSRSSARIG